MEYSDDQALALSTIKEWIRSGGPTLRLGGVAGSGKSTLASKITSWFKNKDHVLFTAITGKACSILKDKLRDMGRGDGKLLTLHRLLYKTSVDKINRCYTKPSLTPSEELNDVKLIIVDEASMVSQSIYKDLLLVCADKNIKVLFMGDHAQLPPIGDGVRLMEDPDIRLDTIHRQAGGNPILQLSQDIRDGKMSLKVKENFNENGEGYSYGGLHKFYREDFNEAYSTQFEKMSALCATNYERVKFNKRVRFRMFTELKPDELIRNGEKLISLNNHKVRTEDEIMTLNNGDILKVESSRHVSTYSDISSEEGAGIFHTHRLDGVISGGKFDSLLVNTNMIGVSPSANKQGSRDPMVMEKVLDLDSGSMGINVDYGYALTCHKAQGSQYDSGFIILPGRDAFIRENEEQFKRWLYTAVTRFKKRVHFITQDHLRML